MSAGGALPELAGVHWRPLVDERSLRRRGTLWTLTTVGHVVPFLGAGALLVALNPIAAPVALACIAHAWIIPALYAQRGANVLKPKRRRGEGLRAGDRLQPVPVSDSEHVAAGLLGDLVGHDARDLHARTGLVTERGRLGVWLVGEAGAVLVRPGGRRAHCYCVRVDRPDLPAGDRIAHLLLALRYDETGFATVANLSFSGAPWRIRPRLDERARPALVQAVELARRHPVTVVHRT